MSRNLTAWSLRPAVQPSKRFRHPKPIRAHTSASRHAPSRAGRSPITLTSSSGQSSGARRSTQGPGLQANMAAGAIEQVFIEGAPKQRGPRHVGYARSVHDHVQRSRRHRARRRLSAPRSAPRTVRSALYFKVTASHGGGRRQALRPSAAPHPGMHRLRLVILSLMVGGASVEP